MTGKTKKFFPIVFICIVWLLVGQNALAGEEGGNWRSTYDMVMLWVNFCILAFVIVKFGKGPIMNFLRGQKEDIAREIHEMEEEKGKAAALSAETRKTLEESESRFEDLKAKIVQQGERKKQEIIEDARRHSQIMMEMAKQRVENQILVAKQAVKGELVDMAVQLATRQLPKMITEEDNQRLFDACLTAVGSGEAAV